MSRDDRIPTFFHNSIYVFIWNILLLLSIHVTKYSCSPGFIFFPLGIGVGINPRHSPLVMWYMWDEYVKKNVKPCSTVKTQWNHCSILLQLLYYSYYSNCSSMLGWPPPRSMFGLLVCCFHIIFLVHFISTFLGQWTLSLPHLPCQNCTRKIKEPTLT